MLLYNIYIFKFYYLKAMKGQEAHLMRHFFKVSQSESQKIKPNPKLCARILPSLFGLRQTTLSNDSYFWEKEWEVANIFISFPSFISGQDEKQMDNRVESTQSFTAEAKNTITSHYEKCSFPHFSTYLKFQILFLYHWTTSEHQSLVNKSIPRKVFSS